MVGLEPAVLNTPMSKIPPEPATVTSVRVGSEMMLFNTVWWPFPPEAVALAVTWMSRGEAEVFRMAMLHSPVPVFCTVRNLSSALLAPLSVPASSKQRPGTPLLIRVCNSPAPCTADANPGSTTLY